MEAQTEMQPEDAEASQNVLVLKSSEAWARHFRRGGKSAPNLVFQWSALWWPSHLLLRQLLFPPSSPGEAGGRKPAAAWNDSCAGLGWVETFCSPCKLLCLLLRHAKRKLTSFTGTCARVYPFKHSCFFHRNNWCLVSLTDCSPMGG